MKHKRVKLPPLGLFLLATLTLCWGFNWPMIKIALSEIPLWTFRTLCLVLGSFGLIVLVKLNGLSLTVPKGEMKPLILTSLLNVTAWYLFSAYGVSHMNAGRASIIAFTMPVWAAILGTLFLRESLSPSRICGLLMGLAGLAILIGPDLKTLGSAPIGALFMLGAAMSWAAGTVMIKYYQWKMPILLLTCWQLILGGIPVIVGAWIIEQNPVFYPVSTKCLMALAYTIIFPTIYSYWAWFKVVELFPATIAAVGTLLIPIIGVFSSSILLGEPAGLRELSSLALVVSALAVVLLRSE